MHDISLFISTRGRGPERQITWNNLTTNIKELTTIVVAPEEYEEFIKYSKELTNFQDWNREQIVSLPSNIIGLSACRQWILDNLIKTKYAIYLDDDLTFFIRSGSNYTKIEGGTIFEVVRMKLKFNPLVGIYNPLFGSEEEHSTSDLSPWQIMRCYGFNAHFFRRNNIRFDYHRLLQDFSINLQLMDLGFDAQVISRICCLDDGPINAPDGGVSVYRSPMALIKTAFQLGVIEHPKSFKRLAKNMGWLNESD